ncbi:MAG: Bug family tripartite tricarboxylate transporter substrate binding protein [Burkholderiaceae bacterium]|jgi:tripartite-type tricarboxylate transporter receptor subunit TctC|nr:Bug family tripartite tricarboxylate transporter substrate binding protein [Burkholderiaceae bacterium]
MNTANTTTRRRFNARLLAAFSASLGAAATATWPLTARAAAKPIHLLVGFAPGGGTDVVARLLAERMQQILGQPVVVENRPGAGGQIAAQALKAAAPDGLTLFISHDHTISILPLVVRNPGFDPARDFASVGGFATFANTFAVPASTPARSMDEYIAWVKARGNQGNVGIPAPASVPEFLVKVLAEKYKLDLVAAPYRGSAPMLADMMGGQLDAGVGAVPEFLEYQRAGKLRILATIGARRQPLLPQVPTFDELGLNDFAELPYYGIYAPAGTPPATLQRLAQALSRAIAEPATRQRLTELGLTVEDISAAKLDSRARAYEKTWAAIIQRSGFQPQ